MKKSKVKIRKLNKIKNREFPEKNPQYETYFLIPLKMKIKKVLERKIF
jgi:hypothetical protein